jgi:hypothetical protein
MMHAQRTRRAPPRYAHRMTAPLLPDDLRAYLDDVVPERPAELQRMEAHAASGERVRAVPIAEQTVVAHTVKAGR